MRTWDVPSRFSTPGQDEPDDVLEARALAERLGIEHHVADVREEFKQIIVKHFIDEYMQGRTPNPCVLCNPLFKEQFSVNGQTKRLRPYLYRALLQTGRTEGKTVYSSGR